MENNHILDDITISLVCQNGEGNVSISATDAKERFGIIRSIMEYYNATEIKVDIEYDVLYSIVKKEHHYRHVMSIFDALDYLLAVDEEYDFWIPYINDLLMLSATTLELVAKRGIVPLNMTSVMDEVVDKVQYICCIPSNELKKFPSAITSIMVGIIIIVKKNISFFCELFNDKRENLSILCELAFELFSHHSTVLGNWKFSNRPIKKYTKVLFAEHGEKIYHACELLYYYIRENKKNFPKSITIADEDDADSYIWHNTEIAVIKNKYGKKWSMDNIVVPPKFIIDNLSRDMVINCRSVIENSYVQFILYNNVRKKENHHNDT